MQRDIRDKKKPRLATGLSVLTQGCLDRTNLRGFRTLLALCGLEFDLLAFCQAS